METINPQDIAALFFAVLFAACCIVEIVRGPRHEPNRDESYDE